MDLDDVVLLLNLSDLKNLNEEKIKQAYRNMIRKYHPDRNPDMGFIGEEITKIVNNAYKEALSNVDEIKKRLIIGSAERAKLDGRENESLFNVDNSDIRPLIIEFMTKLFEKGLNIIGLIKFMNSLEWGFVSIEAVWYILELWGEEAFRALGDFLELQNDDDEKYDDMLKRLKNFITENSVQKKS